MLHQWMQQFSLRAEPTKQLSKECEELRRQVGELNNQIAEYEKRLSQFEAAVPIACELLQQIEDVKVTARALVLVSALSPEKTPHTEANAVCAANEPKEPSDVYATL
jgi:uncharacterized protein YlxW (UPF0749 family)